MIMSMHRRRGQRTLQQQPLEAVAAVQGEQTVCTQHRPATRLLLEPEPCCVPVHLLSSRSADMMGRGA